MDVHVPEAGDQVTVPAVERAGVGGKFGSTGDDAKNFPIADEDSLISCRRAAPDVDDRNVGDRERGIAMHAGGGEQEEKLDHQDGAHGGNLSVH